MFRTKAAVNSLAISLITALFHAPAHGQQNTDLPPVSPQPPAVSSPAPQQLSPSQIQQSAAPLNFQNFNSAPQNIQTQPGAPSSFPPLVTAPPVPTNFDGLTLPQPIPLTSADPFIRGKILIRQATDMISGGQLDAAIALLQKSLEYRKVDPTPQFLLGLIYDQKGNIQAALTNYTQSVQKATSLGMDSAQLRINLANTLVKLNYLKEAEFDYKRAIEIDDKNEVAHLNYGRLLLFKGDNAGAFRELQRAHELMSTDPNLPLYEALALKGLGNLEESRLQLQVFLERAKGVNCDPRVINMAEKLLAELK